MKAKHSLRKLINEHCKDCSYDSLDVGNWRQQVENCCVTSCKLYPVRPVSKPTKTKLIASDV